jgi:hypothetical protein
MQLTLGLALVFAAGCGDKPAPFAVKDRSPKADRPAPFNPPESYPEWAYDSEKYVKPVEDLKPEPRVRPGDPLHYFANKKIVMVRQPSGYTPEEVPRVALWWTDDNGFHWNKGGYFGRQQEYFPFEATEDGDYGVRFVGPGQANAQQVPPTPERVYHVDTVFPEVTVRIEPEQSWYHVGDTVTIRWEASDQHLIEYPVRVGVFPDFSAEARDLTELQRDLADQGSITYKIPPEALDHELRFRVDARDRAGNLGTATSYALQVVSESQTANNEAMKDEESSSKGGKERNPSAKEKIDEDSQSRNDQESEPQGDTPAALALAPEDRRGEEDDDLMNWSGPFFTPPPGDKSKPAEQKPELWYQKALEKITDGSIMWSETAKPAEEAAETATMEEAPSRQPDAAEQMVADAVPVTAAETEATATEAEAPTESATPPVFAMDPPAAPKADEGRVGSGEAFSRGLVSVVDPTRGNGLLVPLPATVEPQSAGTQYVTAHPWRMLGGAIDKPMQSVWVLPKPRFALELYRAIEGRFLADQSALRPAGTPAGGDHAFAGVADPDPPEPPSGD